MIIDAQNNLISEVALVLKTINGEPSELNYYEEIATTIEMSGPFASPINMNVKFYRLNKMVFFDWQDLSGSASNNLKITGNIDDVRFHPANNKNWFVNGTNNTTGSLLAMSIQANGLITIGVTAEQNAFTASGTAAMWGSGVFYAAA